MKWEFCISINGYINILKFTFSIRARCIEVNGWTSITRGHSPSVRNIHFSESDVTGFRSVKNDYGSCWCRVGRIQFASMFLSLSCTIREFTCLYGGLGPDPMQCNVNSKLPPPPSRKTSQVEGFVITDVFFFYPKEIIIYPSTGKYCFPNRDS